MAPSSPLMIRSAASFQRMCRSIISPDRIMLPGFTLSRPAYLHAADGRERCRGASRSKATHLGAVPCVASKMAWPVM
jgi:hypothetical protein